MSDPPPAEFDVMFIDSRDGGLARVYACAGHLAETIRQAHALGAVPAVHEADRAIHGCKGHDAGWPAT